MRIDLLFGDRILFQQLPVTLQIEPGVFQKRLVAHELPFGLHQFRLERTGIEFRQKLAGLDLLAFPEMKPDEFAIHPAADCGGVG